MKKSLMTVVLLGAAWMVGRAQILGGIFDQGATELKEYGKQIVALQLLIDSKQKGYGIVELGLGDIGTIDSGEAAMHRGYFESLAAVNPKVAGMPQVKEIGSLAESIRDRLASSLARWNGSGGLTAAELELLGGMEGRVVTVVDANLGELSDLLTPSKLTLTDDQRITRIGAIEDRMKRLAGFVEEVSVQTDLLVLQRRAAAVEAIQQLYGLPKKE